MARNLSIIEQFDAQQSRYSEFCERIRILLEQLLKNQEIPIHSISARVKTRDSCIKKIQKKDATYRSIEDITDVAGVRVITYFSDQVDKVASIVENEFKVDIKNSIDKRKVLDPDRFGYLSLHYVISLSEARCVFPENQALSGLRAEIQIRSILQHTWAEIEHDLGYKTSSEVPESIRRQFARLAGLLELADDEFVRIRNSLEAYSREVSTKIAEDPNTVSLDRVSLVDFARTDILVRHLDQAIAVSFGCSVRPNEDFIAKNVGGLQFFGLQTIADVKSALEKHKDHIIRLSDRWSKDNEESGEDTIGESISESISLFYLCYILAGASQSINQVHRYLRMLPISDPGEIKQLALELVQFMKDELG
jgi:ppGpp synthetase/RelA/SpoT-type nucleotidyltranferase